MIGLEKRTLPLVKSSSDLKIIPDHPFAGDSASGDKPIEEKEERNSALDDICQYVTDYPHQKYDDIVGCDSAKSALAENVILQLKLSTETKSQIFTGIRAGLGNVLLHGPPGMFIGVYSIL